MLKCFVARDFWSLSWPDVSPPTALTSLLFDPPEPHNIGKTLCFPTCLPFRAPWSSFFWLFLFWPLLFWLFLFSDCSHLWSILSEVWLLNFLRQVYIVISETPNVSPMYPMTSHKHQRHSHKSMFGQATRVGGLLRSVGQIGAFGAVLASTTMLGKGSMDWCIAIPRKVKFYKRHK